MSFFSLALHPNKNPSYAYALGGGFLDVFPQNTAFASQTRVNFCTGTRGPANFCPKTGHNKRFFSLKQQDRSSERDQLA